MSRLSETLARETAGQIIDEVADTFADLASGARDAISDMLAEHEQDIARWIADGDAGQLSVMRHRIETELRKARLDAVRESRETIVNALTAGIRIAIGVAARL